MKKAELVYTVSGHGGAADNIGDCIGPAEEFCKRRHHISFDGAVVTSFDAWRTDCGELCTITENPLPVGPAKFCAENPCGATASVMAARANWCPGDLVAPCADPSPRRSSPAPTTSSSSPSTTWSRWAPGPCPPRSTPTAREPAVGPACSGMSERQ
ncbi:peptide-N-glycosidase F-related protein [Nannocystis pusilla]|uniref:peptide-N-glycosidase F-related protein n=1 Tax=Nannocystis pusilla TaxID=889268 RepID=UPI003B7B02C8